jgi:hypothetical protein
MNIALGILHYLFDIVLIAFIIYITILIRKRID